MTLTCNINQSKFKVDPHAKCQGQRPNSSDVRADTDRQMDGQTDGRTDGETDGQTLPITLSPCFSKATRSTIILHSCLKGLGSFLKAAMPPYVITYYSEHNRLGS